jgi:hypothetical protein
MLICFAIVGNKLYGQADENGEKRLFLLYLFTVSLSDK